MNSDREIELRKSRDNLCNSGAAVLLFGFWMVAKIMIQCMFDRDLYDYITQSITETDLSESEIKIIILIFVGIICLFVLSVHVWIGAGSIRYGKGKKKKRAYLLPAVILILSAPSSIRSDFRIHEIAREGYELSDTAIAAALVDITLTFVLIDIIYLSIKIGSLSRSSGTNGGNADAG